ncbi:hypothetical protein HNR31_003313 [Anoxybacillus caldiproteolyticus]|uniref:Uncharacterized protein n=1 Tax=Thermaerobacillus caldiproteolyticus TaxID=247480 RepID=A0A7V9Z9L6_9BACL|nr:hypothetical protein [Anoxybacillus caldiproteolyticus]
MTVEFPWMRRSRGYRLKKEQGHYRVYKYQIIQAGGLTLFH